jgi:tetratricopeptide (TPR) repeat protein
MLFLIFLLASGFRLLASPFLLASGFWLVFPSGFWLVFPSGFWLALSSRAASPRRDARPKARHASARFQKGLLLERLGKNDAAIEEYARAFRINWKLLQPSINPQIIESRLIDRTLMKVDPDERQRRSLFLQPTPPELIPAPRAPSDLSTPDEIVPPASDTPPQPTPATPALPPPAG